MVEYLGVEPTAPPPLVGCYQVDESPRPSAEFRLEVFVFPGVTNDFLLKTMSTDFSAEPIQFQNFPNASLKMSFAVAKR